MDCGPFVSVIVPCRNEAMHFQTCLDALLANDYPQNRREILIVVGLSCCKVKSCGCGMFCSESLKVLRPASMVDASMTTLSRVGSKK